MNKQERLVNYNQFFGNSLAELVMEANSSLITMFKNLLMNPYLDLIAEVPFNRINKKYLDFDQSLIFITIAPFEWLPAPMKDETKTDPILKGGVIPGLSNRGEIVLLEFTDKMKNKKEVIPVLLPFIFENLDGIKSQLNRISISSITIDEQSGVLLMSLTITLTSFAETKPNDQFDYDFVLDYAVDPLKRVGYPVGR